MPWCRVRERSLLALLALCALLSASIVSCTGSRERPLLPRSQTWAELRVVRRAVAVTPPGESERAPYPRERLVDGEAVRVTAGGLLWLRRDGGATLLVRGPAQLTVGAEAVTLTEGRVFVDTPSGRPTEIVTPSGPLHLAHVRASVDVREGETSVYVLAGEVRTDGAAHAGPGERLTVTGKGKDAKAALAPVVTWEDWTGGLATTDRTAEPSPFGVGTVGARRPGDQGAPHAPLAIQKLDVRVTIDQDFALTEVDEIFFNPSSEVVEGVYRFRTPDGATLHRFGVDRDGVIKWGRVKEKAAAAAQYQANVYQGSTEDPALLEWDAPGVYRARLYPIGPGETRRVVVTYAEWLGRTGANHERRLYVYPMAAEGAEESLPHIEELYASIDLGKAGAKDVRAGMAGVRDGDTLVVREHDLVPRADLAVELFDGGLSPSSWKGYSAPHTIDADALQPSERAEAARHARTESDYVLVPVPGDAQPVEKGEGGLDLAIVVDTSAATEPAALSIARAATGALLAHLGKDDRVVVWGGDSSLRPVVPGKAKLEAADEALRRAVLTQLATVERGGATDLGAMLSEAAAALDPAPGRRGAVVYIGDGAPTVGELSLADLRDRLSKLPRPVRLFGLGVGDGADMAILKGLARGAFAERIGDSNAAARAALRLLEVAERPARLGASVDLGPSVERIFPRDLGALVADESQVVIGRLTGPAPTLLTVNTPAGAAKLQLRVGALDDHGDLRRRWAEGRLAQMIDEGTGRAAMVDLGSRHGIITPVTSLYVPTKNEMSAEERSELERARTARRSTLRRERSKRAAHDGWGKKDEAQLPASTVTTESDEDRHFGMIGAAKSDNKEGGTGTRAKGEEGSMGNAFPSRRAKVATASAPAEAPKADMAPQAAPSVAPLATAMASAAPAPESPAFHNSWGSDKPAAAAPAAPPPPPDEKRAFRGGAKGGEVAKAPAPAGVAGPAAADPRAFAISDSSEFGMIGLLEQKVPAQPAAGDSTVNLPMAPSDGEAFGAGGLGLSGIGEGGGGRGDGLGLGNIGTIGHGAGTGNGQGFGSGHGRLGGSHRAKPPTIRDGDIKVEQEPLDKPVTQVTLRVSDPGHFALRCAPAAFIPFEERVQLWRERLARFTGNANGLARTYNNILAGCEAPTWRERSRLLSLLLDAAPSVPAKVALWKVMFNRLGAGDALYRGILARVRNPQEMRQLHDALGLKSIDPGQLAKILKEAKTPGARVTKLRELVVVWPDDFALALKLLDALEDAGDDAAARELGKKLRARPDADARLRTAVGELYLRLASRATAPEQKALDESEARRAFGEIVEFAPEDPIARRRLGDLLRAHGWYAEASRQYETLARLSPDDPGVALLLAAAAEGLGKLEEAVKWTEKGGASGAPDAAGSAAHTARAFAAAYLAWGRLDALANNRAEEAKGLAARLARVRSSERSATDALRGTRVTLTWAHPELHPTLWTNALGAPMPAPEGDVTLGVAAGTVPVRDGAFVEVRLEPDEVEHAARLGAEAILTVVFDESGEGEKIVKTKVAFTRDGAATKRFSLAAGAVQEVKP